MVVGHGCAFELQFQLLRLPDAAGESAIGPSGVAGLDYIFQYLARCGVTALIVASPRGAGPSGARSLDVSPASAPIDARSAVGQPVQVVATFGHRDHAAAAALRQRCRRSRASAVRSTSLVSRMPAERIVHMRVEARRDQNQLRVETAEHRKRHRLDTPRS